MKNSVLINHKLKPFNKKILIGGDKSISIRWALTASQAIGVSKAYNLLESDDVKNTLNSLKKLGIKIFKKKKYYLIHGNGLNGFNYKKNITLDAGNSGTLARLILGLLVKSKKKISLIGDKSLTRRDFSRVIDPLNSFGLNIKSKNGKLPLEFVGNDYLTPINYIEKIGSAQCKSCVMYAALNTPGLTRIKAKKSRDHTEILFKHLKIPIKIKKTKNFDLIEIRGLHSYSGFEYRIPSDISSSSFFIVLTLLSKNSKLIIKNVNINDTRTGIIKILKKMNAKIKYKNIRKEMGEKISDIHIKSSKNYKSINCPTYYNSQAIDEFLIIFLFAAKAKGVSYFKNLGELNQKESPRLKIAYKFLKMIGVKIIEKKNTIKIFGNPNLKLSGKYVIENFFKDHRVFMMSVIAALTLGGRWIIKDKDSINSSFPDFISKIKSLGAKIS